MHMLHHLSFAVLDLERSARFYDAVLAPLGYVRAFTQESGNGRRESAIGYGRPGAEDEFAIRLRQQGVVAPSEGFHLAFTAPSRETATAFHQAALAHGGQDNGGVGLHPEHGPNYFAAFVLDPDGYRIEAVVAGKA
jgi:catechol 2,3-dioxygenase-like lactoylglutathione lyase family enzyme